MKSSELWKEVLLREVVPCHYIITKENRYFLLFQRLRDGGIIVEELEFHIRIFLTKSFHSTFSSESADNVRRQVRKISYGKVFPEEHTGSHFEYGSGKGEGFFSLGCFKDLIDRVYLSFSQQFLRSVPLHRHELNFHTRLFWKELPEIDGDPDKISVFIVKRKWCVVLIEGYPRGLRKDRK